MQIRQIRLSIKQIQKTENMKTMMKLTLVIAFATFAGSVFGRGNLSVNMEAISGDRAVMSISSLTNSSYEIAVTDEKNRIVFFQEISEPNPNYRKVYDFSDLDEGKYTLTVKSDDLSCEREFEKNRNSIIIGKEKTSLKPYFGYDNGLLRCSYMNFEKENLTLYLFEKNQLIYSKNIGRDFNVREALNLAKLTTGDYQVVLATENKEYNYGIHID